MWRFKTSKYKNAVPKVHRRGEDWITDISVGSLPYFGNHIKASAAFIAFNVGSASIGNLGILQVTDSGTLNKNISVLRAHSDFVTDFDFCPYDDGILATGSHDHHVKIWRITESSYSNSNLFNPEIDLLLQQNVEILKFHPQADCILSTVENNIISLWDVTVKEVIRKNFAHEDIIQTISWRYSGTTLASCGKDKKLRIWDPRDPGKTQVTSSHSNNKDSRVIWLGDTDYVLTTGFGNCREREVFLRDIRKLDNLVASYSGDSSLGVYIPLFDPDTNMLFLVAKADMAVSFWEILDSAPFLQEATKFINEVQAKGATLLPKRILNAMEGEVNKLLILGQDCIVPVSYQVPRKSYRDFHQDLFPDTFAPEPSLTSAQWQMGDSAEILKVSLMPSKQKQPLVKLNHVLGSGPMKKENFLHSSESHICNIIQEKVSNSGESGNQRGLKVLSETLPLQKQQSPNLEIRNNSEAVLPHFSVKYSTDSAKVFHIASDADSSQTPRKCGRTFGMRVSKFRHLNGNIFPKEYHITDLCSLTKTTPGECNGFDANVKYAAVPIGAANNFLGILELSKSGRVPAVADMSGFSVGAAIMDFAWDPFDSSRLAVACDDGDIQIWVIPKNGICQKLQKPTVSFRIPSVKVTLVKFHPCANDIIATASSDFVIRIWDIASQEIKFHLVGHTDQILNCAWSPDGRHLASVSKDKKIRIFDPRNSSKAIKEGAGPQGTRGARIAWVLSGTHLLVSGFSKVSERQIFLYDCDNLSNPLGNVGLDVSPSTLIPHYDGDSSTLFLTGKGDSVIYAYEVATDHPYFYPLSHYKCNHPHQALSFLPKFVCNMKEVEFARAVRLTTTTIEPISFHVPRLRLEFFQDDLFPPTLKTWVPSMTSSEWITGVNKPLEIISLQPEDMKPLSKAAHPVQAPNDRSSGASANVIFEGEVTLKSSLSFLQNSKEKEEKIVQSMLAQCELKEDSLPQEAFEGVDPTEWEDDEQHCLEENL